VLKALAFIGKTPINITSSCMGKSFLNHQHFFFFFLNHQHFTWKNEGDRIRPESCTWDLINFNHLPNTHLITFTTVGQYPSTKLLYSNVKSRCPKKASLSLSLDLPLALSPSVWSEGAKLPTPCSVLISDII
jgi:hypothetical protein